MFARLRRTVGLISVTEKDNVISVEGVPADVIARDISKIWSTSKINLHMFLHLTKNSFSFYSFFGPDIIYALNVIGDNKRGWMSKRVVDNIIDKIYRHTWLSETISEKESILNYPKLNQINLKLLPHQLEFLQTYDKVVPRFNLNGYLLSAAAGSGKTIATLSLGIALGVDKVIIVAPKHSLERVWAATLETNLVSKPKYWLASSNLPYKGEKYLIGHFEAISKIKGQLLDNPPINPLVILDESHNLNEIKAQRTLAFIDLVRYIKAKHVVWSSGTPLKALGYEIIPLLRTIDPLFTDKVEERFRMIYGRNASRALDILKNRIGIISYKVAKVDIQTIKPTEHDVLIKLKNGYDYTLDAIRLEMRNFIEERLNHYKEFSKHYRKDYDEAIEYHENTLESKDQKNRLKLYKEYIKLISKGYIPELHKAEVMFANEYELKTIIPSLPKEMREGFKNSRSVIKYVNLKVMGEALGGVLGKKRAQCHVDMVKSFSFSDIIDNSAKKTVIFTSFVEVLKEIDVKLKIDGYSPVSIYGDTNKNVNPLIESFFKNDDINPLVATYQSLSTAVPLIAANTSIFINQPFRDYIKVQAQARVDRIGQDQPVHFFNLVLDTGTVPNISTRSADILEWSKEQVALMMGDEMNANNLEAVTRYYNSTESFNDPIIENFERVFNSFFK